MFYGPKLKTLPSMEVAFLENIYILNWACQFQYDKYGNLNGGMLTQI